MAAYDLSCLELWRRVSLGSRGVLNGWTCLPNILKRFWKSCKLISAGQMPADCRKIAGRLQENVVDTPS